MNLCLRSLRYFDPPTMSEVSKVSQACDLTTSSINREPFFLNEELPRSSLGKYKKNSEITKLKD